MAAGTNVFILNKCVVSGITTSDYILLLFFFLFFPVLYEKIIVIEYRVKVKI